MRRKDVRWSVRRQLAGISPAVEHRDKVPVWPPPPPANGGGQIRTQPPSKLPPPPLRISIGGCGRTLEHGEHLKDEAEVALTVAMKKKKKIKLV